MNDVEDRLVERRRQILYKIRLSSLYHLKEQRFYDLADAWVSAFLLVFATGTFTAIIKESSRFEQCIAGTTAILAVLQMVFRPGAHARDHGAAAAEFRRLRAEAEGLGEEWSEEQCNRLTSRTVELEAAEPSSKAALVAACQNELALGMDSPALLKLSWWERKLMHLVSFDAGAIQQRSELEWASRRAKEARAASHPS